MYTVTDRYLALFGQGGDYRALHHVVPLIGHIVQGVCVQNGGAVPAEGASQQEVGGYIIKIAGFYHKHQAGLTGSVLVVGKQCLGYTQRLGGLPLRNTLLLPQQGEGSCEIRVCHPDLPLSLCCSPRRGGPENTAGIV